MDEYERREILRQLANMEANMESNMEVKRPVEATRPMDEKPAMDVKARWVGVCGLDPNATRE